MLSRPGFQLIIRAGLPGRFWWGFTWPGESACTVALGGRECRIMTNITEYGILWTTISRHDPSSIQMRLSS